MGVPPRHRTAVLIVVVALALAPTWMAGCGSVTPPRSQPAPCGRPAGTVQTKSMIPAAAALLYATVHVTGERAAHPACVVLTTGSEVSLRLGDRAELVANQEPEILPAAPGVVRVSTRPGPAERGPGGPGGLSTAHVIVTLTAVRAGTVTARWIDCSGTGC